MKSIGSLLAIALALIAAAPCSAVGNRVIGDMAQLEKIGFDFENVTQSDEGVISFRLVAPTEFRFESGGFELTKPFSGLSYMKTLKPVERDTHLIGTPSSHFDLATRQRKDRRHESRISLLTADASQAYFAVTFSEGAGSLLMIIHIPISDLLKGIRQTENENTDAEQPAPAPGSN
ncbi:MAG: hypothetical protein R3F11_26795 [Verrucomicrobiales bacterium]